MTMIFNFLAILIAINVLSINGQIQPRIYGGSKVPLNELSKFKYQALVYSNGVIVCGGAVISPNTIITAAHCVYNMSRATIALGLHDLNDVTTAKQIILVKPEHWVYHKDYDYKQDTAENDIAIINVPRTIEFNDLVGPIALECNNGNRHENEMVRISGWGKHTDDFFQLDSSILRSVEVLAIPFNKCQTTYGYKKDFPTMFCLDGSNNSGSCEGDSGGPIVSVKDEKLVAVVSFGAENCEVNYPRVGTRLSEFSKWIQDNSVDHIENC